MLKCFCQLIRSYLVGPCFSFATKKVFHLSQWCRLARVRMSGLMTRDIPRHWPPQVGQFNATCKKVRSIFGLAILRRRQQPPSFFSRSASRAPSLLFSTESRTCAHCLVACSSFSVMRFRYAHYCPLGTESGISFFLHFFFCFHSLSQTYSSSSSVHRTVTHTDDVTSLLYTNINVSMFFLCIIFGFHWILWFWFEMYGIVWWNK